MSLTLNTNCGFVTSAPSADPSGSTAIIIDTRSRIIQDTTPAGATQITEIGWWCDNATQAADFDVGIYSDSAGSADSLIHVSRDNAKGTSSGWKKVTGLEYSISAETTYWIGVQLDDTSTQTNIDYNSSGLTKTAYMSSQSSLTSSWSSGGGDPSSLVAIYAVVEVPSNAGFFAFFCEAWQKHDRIWKPKLAIPKLGYEM